MSVITFEKPARQNSIATGKRVTDVLSGFTVWLSRYGELSRDHQTFFAGPVGQKAKALYYRHKLLGTATVAPMIFLEAFLPSGRRFFHHPTRFPIADAHYAMGFAFLFQVTGDDAHLRRAIHFLEELSQSRCPVRGLLLGLSLRLGHSQRHHQNSDAAHHLYSVCLRSLSARACGRWTQGVEGVMSSIARHAFRDIKDFPTSEKASSCSYTPFDKGGVINAAAYRAFLLTSASQVFSNYDYRKTAERNLNFVLENQNSDGSWFYAVDGVRDFVDHYHTCFVMKALAKIHTLTGCPATLEALRQGVSYYLDNLFDTDRLPKPFSRAPRLTIYKRELYDCAECINLCLLLRDRFPVLGETLESVVEHVLQSWVNRDGSFRSRKLHFGWDNVPMHRWGQAQTFRSLAFYASTKLHYIDNPTI